MGRCSTHKKPKKKGYSHKTALRAKFMKKGDDLIHAELLDERKPLPLDEDLPGMGQYYCMHCDRYFTSANIRDDHFKTKLHKKRVKLMKGAAPHTQLDAELAAGMGRPDNGPKLRESSSAIPMSLLNGADVGKLGSVHYLLVVLYVSTR
ncbi:hypothetical protein R1sor_008559 [Riccia sorocarpa]|uniref:C2H2-type domain-containing protein n=1 Tax=Riccia sorocarpa TaxID=122646 RepID=A0ABD3HTS0_9MARC